MKRAGFLGVKTPLKLGLFGFVFLAGHFGGFCVSVLFARGCEIETVVLIGFVLHFFCVGVRTVCAGWKPPDIKSGG